MKWWCTTTMGRHYDELRYDERDEYELKPNSSLVLVISFLRILEKGFLVTRTRHGSRKCFLNSSLVTGSTSEN